MSWTRLDKTLWESLPGSTFWGSVAHGHAPSLLARPRPRSSMAHAPLFPLKLVIYKHRRGLDVLLWNRAD